MISVRQSCESAKPTALMQVDVEPGTGEAMAFVLETGCRSISRLPAVVVWHALQQLQNEASF